MLPECFINPHKREGKTSAQNQNLHTSDETLTCRVKINRRNEDNTKDVS